MNDKKITSDELKTIWMKDIDHLAKQVADAINQAKPGNIINESEEPVRDAHAEFRKRAFQEALTLLQNKALQGDFSPSEDGTGSALGQ